MTIKDLKTFLENILRNYEKDDSIVITGIQEKDYNIAGVGCMSEVSGLEVIGTRGSGKYESKQYHVIRHLFYLF